MCVRAKRENGWHDLQRRLLDAGRTDYASYAFYEKEMTPVPGQKDCFNYKGRSVIANPDGCVGAQSTELFVSGPFFSITSFYVRVLRLVGMNRQNPRRLIDDYTKEVSQHS
jgi:hypothetical protein